MRLSEAILLGSTVTKQGTGWGKYDTACALRAATVALGIEETYPALWAAYPWSFDEYVHCPVTNCQVHYGSFPVFEAIFKLNDWHLWTREQIAEWVAKIEPAETFEPAVESVTEAVCA